MKNPAPIGSPPRRALSLVVVLAMVTSVLVLNPSLALAAVPSVTNSAGPLAYGENDPATEIDPLVAVTDPDGTLESATVGIVEDVGGTYLSEDELACASCPGSVAAVFDPGPGVLTITGPASVADFQLALRAVTYVNNAVEPDVTPRTATFSVNDLTDSDSDTIGITVTDVNDNPPVIDPGQSFPVAEDASDATVVGTAVFSDADAVAVATGFSIDSGDTTGSFSIDASGVITVVNPPGLDFETTPSYTLMISATDGVNPDAPAEAVVITVTDANDPPTANDATFQVGENAANGTSIGTIDATDVDSGDVLSFSITSGDPDGVFAISSSGLITVADNPTLDFGLTPTYILTVLVFDLLLASDTATITVDVVPNQIPVVDPIATLTGTEGSATLLAASFSDVDDADGHTVTIDWGDGDVEQGTVDQVTNSVSRTHIYDDDGTYAVEVTVIDTYGASSGPEPGTAIVSNAVPVVDGGTQKAAIEGNEVTLDVAAFTDAGTVDSHTATVDWDDGSPLEAGVVVSATAALPPHTYVDDGTFDVDVCVDDDDGGRGCDTVTVTISNDAPDFTVFGIFDEAGNPAIDFKVGEVVEFSGEFVDEGDADVHTLTVDWGDGTLDSLPVPLERSVTKTFSATHVYTAPGPAGSYTARVTVDDGDGGSDTLSGPVNVSAAVHTVGLVDASQGMWHLVLESGSTLDFFYGNPGDVPIVGDWTCDGTETVGLFRLSDAFFYLRFTNTAGPADLQFFAGDPSDIPLAGDFDGDGCGDVALYRPSNQHFFVFFSLPANNGSLGVAPVEFTFGNPGDSPVVGDWDGDGEDEVGLYRGSTGLFYFRNTLTAGVADGQFTFGNPADQFIAGAWIGQGFDAPGVFRPSEATFYLKYSLQAGNADTSFPFGLATWIPIAGTFA